MYFCRVCLSPYHGILAIFFFAPLGRMERFRNMYECLAVLQGDRESSALSTHSCMSSGVQEQPWQTDTSQVDWRLWLQPPFCRCKMSTPNFKVPLIRVSPVQIAAPGLEFTL